MSRFDFRDMLGGADAKLNTVSDFPPGMMEHVRKFVLETAATYKMHPASVAAGCCTETILQAHILAGIEKAREAAQHISDVVDGVRDTAEECERDRRRGQI
jgi:hypothetical protein